MITMEDAQQRPYKTEWICWICRKQVHGMELASCCRIPRHIISYRVEPEDYILTTICKRCSNLKSSYDN